MADSVRTVSVELKMKISDFEAGAAKAAATMKGLAKDVDSFGKSSKTGFSDASKSSSDFSSLIQKSLRDDVTGFDSIRLAIDDTKTHIESLKSEIHTGSGSDTIFGDLKSAQNDLRSLESVFKDLTPAAADAGEQSGKSFISSFGKSASELVPDLVSNPVSLGLVAGITAVAVPAITLAFEGAIAGGVGLGLVGAAALIQKNNPAIVSAVGDLRDDAVSVFKLASEPLVSPFVDAIHYADQLVVKEGPELQRIFTDLGPAINPLVHGLGTLVDDTLPSLDKLAKTFATSLNNPGAQGAVLGLDQSLNSLLNTVGNNPQAVSDGLSILFNTFHAGIATINAVASAVNSLDGAFHDLPPFLQDMITKQEAAKESQQGFATSSQQVVQAQIAAAGGIANYNKALGELQASLVGGAQPAINSVGTALQQYAQAAQAAELATMALNDSQLNGEIAANDFNTSVTNLESTLKTNKNSLAAHTAAGEADRGMILGIIEQQKQNIPLWAKTSLGIDGATKKYNTNLTSLEKQLAANGQLTPAIQKLIDKYLAVPPVVKTKISNNADAAKKSVSGLNTEIENIPRSKTFTLHVETKGNLNQAVLLARTTGQRIANAEGGVYTHADIGLVNAGIYSAKAPARYAFAEPQTGGEAFIPKVGNYGRSMNILSAAAGWYGAHVVPGGGRSSAGSGPINITITASDPQGKAFLAAARLAVQQNGSGVVNAFTPR